MGHPEKVCPKCRHEVNIAHLTHLPDLARKIQDWKTAFSRGPVTTNYDDSTEDILRSPRRLATKQSPLPLLPKEVPLPGKTLYYKHRYPALD